MSEQPVSIKDALQYGYSHLGNERRLEVELLLAYLLHVDRSYLLAHDQEHLPLPLFKSFNSLCNCLAIGKPLAYLLGEKEFWSHRLEVNEHTLIPRPETELLIEMALKLLPQKESLNVLELGVGSGGVVVALAAERPNWQITGIEISECALEVAKRNVARYHLENIKLFKSDWYTSLPHGKFQAIISNPPYISEEDPHLEALQYEPQLALVAGKEGLDAIKEIIAGAKDFLLPGGLLLLEHGYDQSNRVRQLLTTLGFINATSYLDLSGLERVTVGYWKEVS